MFTNNSKITVAEHKFPLEMPLGKVQLFTPHLVTKTNTSHTVRMCRTFQRCSLHSPSDDLFITTHNDLDSADPSSMQDTCHI